MTYQNLSAWETAHLLRADQYARWSYNGATALAEYFEQLEDEGNTCTLCGCDTTRIQIDIVAIRCEYSEYTSAIEAAREHGNDYSINIYDEDDNERPQDEVTAELEAYCLEWLQQRTNTLPFEGGIIIEQF